MNDTQKAPLLGRPWRTVSRCIVLVVLVAVGIVMAGCTSPEQKDLAKQLSDSGYKMNERLYESDTQLINTMSHWNPTTIEQAITDLNAMKDSWQRQSEPAADEVKVAADKFAESLSMRVKAYQAAAQFARLGNVGVPKGAMKLLADSGAPALDALDRLSAIGG